MNLKLLEKGFFIAVLVIAALLLVLVMGVGFVTVMDKISEILCLFI